MYVRALWIPRIGLLEAASWTIKFSGSSGQSVLMFKTFVIVRLWLQLWGFWSIFLIYMHTITHTLIPCLYSILTPLVKHNFCSQSFYARFQIFLVSNVCYASTLPCSRFTWPFPGSQSTYLCSFNSPLWPPHSRPCNLHIRFPCDLSWEMTENNKSSHSLYVESYSNSGRVWLL